MAMYCMRIVLLLLSLLSPSIDVDATMSSSAQGANRRFTYPNATGLVEKPSIITRYLSLVHCTDIWH